jgi:photosystem II biogenesis protein Psp29
VSNLSTVSDTKRKFYNSYTRPINSIFRRVVEELIVEMHLLLVNDDFNYDSIYALGVVSSFDRFMANYRPEEDKAPIFTSLCQAVDSSVEQYRQDASAVKALGDQLGDQDTLGKLVSMATSDATDALSQNIKAVSNNPKFKYSRLFGIGLFTLIEGAAPEKLTTEEGRKESIEKLSAALRLPTDKLGKDLDSYRSNLSKLVQMEAAMADVLEAGRKKREQREQEKAAKQSEKSETPPSEASA